MSRRSRRSRSGFQQLYSRKTCRLKARNPSRRCERSKAGQALAAEPMSRAANWLSVSGWTLLEQALSHISAFAGLRNRADSYQRLEFLGDHVLGLVISDMLFRAFPKADEGEMSRRLADLVRKEACADVARTIELGSAIRLGASEINAGGRSRTAILADVCEALIGAIFVDGGYAAASALIERLWSERMRAPKRPLRDAKTALQEWAQARGLPTPAYREIERKVPTTIQSSAYGWSYRICSSRGAWPLQACSRTGRCGRHAHPRGSKEDRLKAERLKGRGFRRASLARERRRMRRDPR